VHSASPGPVGLVGAPGPAGPPGPVGPNKGPSSLPNGLGSPNPLHDTTDTVTISVKVRIEEIICIQFIHPSEILQITLPPFCFRFIFGFLEI
jgi:hypothetical protein